MVCAKFGFDENQLETAFEKFDFVKKDREKRAANENESKKDK